MLPFSRRVVDIDLPWLIKEQQQQQSLTSMINHGQTSSTHLQLDVEKENIKTDNDLYIIDKR